MNTIPTSTEHDGTPAVRETTPMPKDKCLVCGSSDPSPLFGSARPEYVACGDCHTAWIHPLPGSNDAAELYGSEYFDEASNGGYPDYLGDEPLHRRNAEARLEYLGPPTSSGPTTLIDVGCAAGFFLDEARSLGWSPVGVDISSWAQRHAAVRLGMEVHPTLAEAGQTAAPFGAVTFFQCLEHMSRPDREIATAYENLAPGGKLVIESWNRHSLIARLMRHHWQQVTPPSVIWLFTSDSLAKLLARTGFMNVQVERSSKWISLGMISSLLASKSPKLFDAFDKWVRKRGLDRRGIPYRIGDLITATAVKP